MCPLFGGSTLVHMSVDKPFSLPHSLPPLHSLPLTPSGGHFNPAVTLGVLLAGGINVVASLCYFLAQLVGGIVGAACVLVSLRLQVLTLLFQTL